VVTHRCQDRGHIAFPYGPLLLWICCFQGWGLSASQSGQETPAPPISPVEQINRLKQQEITVLQELMRDCPGRLDPQMLMARTLYRHGRDSEAVSIWNTIRTQYPQRTDVYDLLGMAAFRKGQYEQAIAHWQRALKVNPKLPNAHSSIAKALTALGRQQEAIAAFEKEIEISPASALNYFLLAQQLLQQDQATQAKQYYEGAIARNPKLINAYYGLFQAYSRLREHEQAQRYLKIFKQLKTQKQRARNESILAFDDLTKTKRDTALTYTLVGRIYLINRMLDKAEAPLKEAVALCPDRPDYANALAMIYQKSNRLVEALELYETAGRLTPSDPRAFTNIARVATDLNRYDKAEAAWRRVIALAPQKSAGYRELAYLFLQTGTNSPEALKLAQQALLLEPTAANYFVHSRACEANGDSAGALDSLEHAVALEPDNQTYRRALDTLRKEGIHP
jgi:tetratricopeptide (TPR) repeat protein